MGYASVGQLHLPANLPLFQNKAQQQAYLGNARAGLNQSGTAYGTYNAPTTQLSNAGQQGSPTIGQRWQGWGLPLQHIEGPPPAPGGGGGGGGNQPPYSPNTVNQTVDYGGRTWRGNPGQGWNDLGSTEERRHQQELATWQAAQAAHQPPVTAPPPAPVAGTQVTRGGVSGATAAPGTVGTGGGVTGKAFPATSQFGLGTKGLQLSGIAPQAASAQMIPTLPKGQPTGITPEFVSQLQQNTGANVPQTQSGTGYHPQADTGGVTDPVRRLSEQFQSFLGLSPAQQVHPIQNFIDTMQRGGASAAKADINLGKLGTPQAMTKSVLGAQGVQQTPMQSPTASYANLSGSLPAEQHPQAIQSFLSGQSPMSDVASAIASPEAQGTINKMIDKAQKSGDMTTVGRLADLHAAVQTQLNFISQIGQIVSAMSSGFGTPNAPGVTAARTPMVQQGIGQALTSTPLSQTPGGAPGQQTQMYSPRLPTSPVQQQKPPVFSYMGR